MTTVSVFALVLILVPLSYLLVLAVASAKPHVAVSSVERAPSTRFMIAIAAHNEANVIQETVSRLRAVDYPSELFDIYVVADHCSDNTAALACVAGARVYERSSGSRTGKGTALQWLFDRMLNKEDYTVTAIFDADTLVDPEFLRIMDLRFSQGDQVVQGQHVISNPNDSWFAALIWAMFIIDNRIQNHGRANLCLSAKNMGDSVCFRSEILGRYGWGSGLADDYDLRQRLLLEGIRIRYEPTAKGFGEAPTAIGKASAQRARWLAGSSRTSAKHRGRLLGEGIRRRDAAMIDGALQAWLPSYSTLSAVATGSLVAHIFAGWVVGTIAPMPLLAAWIASIVLLFAYPFVGLMLERSKPKAYIAILAGPIFIAWRAWLAIGNRRQGGPANWVRTAHGDTSIRS